MHNTPTAPNTAKATTINFEIESLPLTGNVVPNMWFQNVKYPNGKANLLAITILAEVVWWYRPYEVRDSSTGLSKQLKKFSADKLQLSYQSLADKFGVTKRQIKDASKFLQKQGLITLELRNIVTKSGQTLANVLFIEPIPLAIAAISMPSEVSHSEEVCHSNVGGVTLERNTVSHSNVGGVTLERQTYTDISSKKSNTKSTHTDREIPVCAANQNSGGGKLVIPIETEPELTEEVGSHEFERPKGYLPPKEDFQVPETPQKATKQPNKPTKQDEWQTVDLSDGARGFCERWEISEAVLRKALRAFDPAEWKERMAWADCHLSQKQGIRDRAATAIAALKEAWGWPGIERARQVLPEKMQPLANFPHEKPDLSWRRQLRETNNPVDILKSQIFAEQKRIFGISDPLVFSGIPSQVRTVFEGQIEQRFSIDALQINHAHSSDLSMYLRFLEQLPGLKLPEPEFSEAGVNW